MGHYRTSAVPRPVLPSVHAIQRVDACLPIHDAEDLPCNLGLRISCGYARLLHFERCANLQDCEKT